MQSFSKLYLTHPWRLSAFAAFLGALSISPSVSAAQVIDMNNSGVQKGIMDAIGKAFQKQMDAALARTVKITPQVAELATGAKSVTIDLENPTDDTLTVNLLISSMVPQPFRVASVASQTATDSAKPKTSAKTTSILSDEQESKPESKDDGTYSPMGPWLKGLPKQYVILPKAKVKVVLDVNIPADVAAGEYVTWIAAEVEPKKAPAKPKDEQKQLEAVLPGGTPLKLNVVGGTPSGGLIVISSAKIVYKHSSSK